MDKFDMIENFEITKEALTRAAYRALLNREPEHVAEKLFRFNPFDDEYENELQNLLRQFTQSQEFREKFSQTQPKPNYPPSTWARVEVAGILLWVDLGDLGVSQHCVTDCYEPTETAFVRGFLKPGMTFVDIGANIGWFSVNAAKLVGPTGKVIAFEPRNDSFNALRRSFEDNQFMDRANLFNAAAGTEAGEISIGWDADLANPGGTWTISNEELGNSFRNRNASMQTAPVMVLDDVVGEQPIDLLKIDIEGAEPIALGGATNILKNQRPLILSELSPSVLAAVSNTTPTEFIAWMGSFDYSCHVLEPEGCGVKLDPANLSNDGHAINVIFKPNAV